jgi:hypothetical protein
MPAYNHAPYARDAVESVLGQTYANLELIVIDDASTDETWSVLQSFDDVRIRLLRHEVNQGAHATLNEALALAQGDFIAIINSDDVYHPERLEKLLSVATRGEGGDTLIFSDVAFIDAQGVAAEEHPRAARYRILKARCATLPSPLWLLTGNPLISTSNFFCSRNLGVATGRFAPLRYTHDWDWALRATGHAAPVWVGETLLSYRVHSANTLSEDDRWRHIHENSYIQTRTLRALGETMVGGRRDPAALRMIGLALLGNESLHPLALNLFLAWMLSGVGDDELLALTSARDGSWMLKEVAEATACPADVFGSIGRLAESAKVIETQAALIEERWNAMHEMSEQIAKQDACIAAQAGLIDERWNAMQEMSTEIAQRDASIAAQAGMIEERWNAMQQMGAEIASRDSKIRQLEKDLARPLVKLALFMCRKLD